VYVKGIAKLVIIKTDKKQKDTYKTTPWKTDTLTKMEAGRTACPMGSYVGTLM